MATISQPMDDNTVTADTAELPVSQARSEIIKEAKRLEESLSFSAKGHFSAASVWGNFHLIIGVPMVILSATAGASALAQFDPNHVIAGVLAISVAVLSGVMTFLNPNEKNSAHLNAGNHYAALRDKVRIFWCIDCWREESEALLTDRIKQFAEQKDKLNQSCPQIPTWAYRTAKEGIEQGEASYTIDRK